MEPSPWLVRSKPAVARRGLRQCTDCCSKGFIEPQRSLAQSFVLLDTLEANRREAGAALRLVNVLPDCGAPLTALAPARVSSPASAEAFSFSSADEEEDELADEADDERLVKRENIFILSWRERCGGASKDFAAARAGRPFVGARSRFDPRPSFDLRVLMGANHERPRIPGFGRQRAKLTVSALK